MNIAIICLTYGRGGVGGHAKMLANQLVQQGHEITVYTDLRPKPASRSGPNVVPLRVDTRRGFPTMWNAAARHELTAQRGDLRKLDVLIGNPVLGGVAREALEWELPYVTTLHGSLRRMVSLDLRFATEYAVTDPVTTVYQLVDSYLEASEYRHARGVVAVSNSVLNEFMHSYGVRSHCTVIPPMMRIRDQLDEASVRSILLSMGLEMRGYLLYVGTFIPRKGLHLLLKAFSRLNNRRTKLVLVGGGGRPYFSGLLDRLDISKRVILHSWLPSETVGALLQGAECFCFPSIYEGSPMAVAEAMLAALPVIAYRTSGTVDLVTNGVTGYLAPLGDVEAFSHLLQTVLDDNGLRARLSKAARAEAARRFSPQSIGDAYMTVLRAATEDGNGEELGGVISEA